MKITYDNPACPDCDEIQSVQPKTDTTITCSKCGSTLDVKVKVREGRTIYRTMAV